MAFNVRVFGLRGIKQIPQLLVRQYNSDSVFMFEEPYAWASGPISVSSVAISTPAQDPDLATFVRIEIPDNQAIRYEINPPGRAVAAGTNSPRITGSDQFAWGKGWTISIVDAANLP